MFYPSSGTLLLAPTSLSPDRTEEIVLGLVHGAGTDVDPLEHALRSTLARYGYRLQVVHLSSHFASILGRAFNREAPDATRDLHDMGDALREKLGGDERRADGLARLAVYLIADLRRQTEGSSSRIAWLVRSLRRPEEVEELRRVYGTRSILVGAHAPESVLRLQRLRTQGPPRPSSDLGAEPGLLEPRVLREKDTFGFGGSVVPDTYLATLEQDTVQAFVELVGRHPDLRLTKASTNSDVNQ